MRCTVWRHEPKRDVLRIGRDKVEQWAWTPNGLCLADSQSFDSNGPRNTKDLESVMTALLARTLSKAGQTRPRFDLVLESAWLPVLELPLGFELWSQARLLALLRHRLQDGHGTQVSAQGPAGEAWEPWVEYRAGDPIAIGFGLARSVRQLLLETLKAFGARAASLQPALSWGWQQAKSMRRPARSGWWLWLEQDRAMACRIERSSVQALHPALPLPSDSMESLRLVQMEAVRQGLSTLDAPVSVAGWRDLEAIPGLLDSSHNPFGLFIGTASAQDAVPAEKVA